MQIHEPLQLRQIARLKGSDVHEILLSTLTRGQTRGTVKAAFFDGELGITFDRRLESQRFARRVVDRSELACRRAFRIGWHPL